MSLSDRVKTAVRNWLMIEPAQPHSIIIREPLSFEGSVIRNQIWYRGDPAELSQLYKSIDNAHDVNLERFWSAVPENGKVRKIHSGVPALIVDTIAYIVVADMSDVDFGNNQEAENNWKKICEELDFRQLVHDAIVGTLVSGDGAFKISVDKDISQYPLVEFYTADTVVPISERGRITAIKFYGDYGEHNEQYRLEESYERGKVLYALYDKDEQVSLEKVPELADLKDVAYNGNYFMAQPLMFFANPKCKGRGKSIYDTKQDAFDAHDEVISQWLDALRAGRVSKYIPENMLPVNPKNGDKLSLNSFGTEFIAVAEDNSEGAQNKIDVVQPDIKYEALLCAYTTTLTLCLQGIISPATIGIDVGKMSSADAQREKKDVTGYTRNKITDVLEKELPKLIKSILMTYDNMLKNEVGDYNPVVTFGEYGAPDFDTRVDVVGKASQQGVMSIESSVDELWGSSKDEKWKKTEVQRLKSERGIEVVNEPSVGDEV